MSDGDTGAHPGGEVPVEADEQSVELIMPEVMAIRLVLGCRRHKRDQDRTESHHCATMI